MTIIVINIIMVIRIPYHIPLYPSHIFTHPHEARVKAGHDIAHRESEHDDKLIHSLTGHSPILL